MFGVEGHLMWVLGIMISLRMKLYLSLTSLFIDLLGSHICNQFEVNIIIWSLLFSLFLSIDLLLLVNQMVK